MKRAMAPSETLLSLLSPSPQERLAACERFCLLSEMSFTPDILERLTAEGFFEHRQVNWNGVPQYSIWFHKTVDNGLHVNCALQMCSAPLFETLAAALHLLAEQNGCAYVQFTTRRPGLVAKSESYGYHAQSIVMVKSLSPSLPTSRISQD